MTAKTDTEPLRAVSASQTDAGVSELHLRLCPYCYGREPELSDCTHCEQTGLFDQDGKPFTPPPPFDTWTPERLAALSAASARRDAGSPLNDKPRRLTQSQIVERLLHALNRGGQDHSTIELSRNAKGDTQIRVSVRTGEGGVETVEEARAKATEQYDHLRELYPLAPVTTK
jgi:hypothetical protein